MPDIAEYLVTKYSLTQAPSADQVQQWATLAETKMNSGADGEQAGKDAAKEVFPELFRT